MTDICMIVYRSHPVSVYGTRRRDSAAWVCKSRRQDLGLRVHRDASLNLRGVTAHLTSR